MDTNKKKEKTLIGHKLCTIYSHYTYTFMCAHACRARVTCTCTHNIYVHLYDMCACACRARATCTYTHNI